MNLTLKKDLYDNMAPWKWRALRHVMGDLLLGTPAGLDDESPYYDADGNRVVVFSDDRFDSEKAAALRLVLAGIDALPDDPLDTPEVILSAVADKGGMASEWSVGASYAVDQTVFYQGRVWRCLQAHTSQSDWSPPAAVSLWTGYRNPGEGAGGSGTPDEWVQPTGAHDAYNTGDRVTYQGSVYESTIDANVWAPDVYPQGWVLIE